MYVVEIKFKASNIKDAYEILDKQLPWDVVASISNLSVNNGEAMCNVTMNFPSSLDHNFIMDLMFEFIELGNNIDFKIPHAT